MSNLGRCRYCQKFFKALTQKRKYCSILCRSKYYYRKKRKPKLLKDCIQCKKEFTTSIAVRIFCSIKCKDIFHKQGIVKLKICLFCNNGFTCTNNSQKYCSNNCYKFAKKIRDKEYYERSIK